MNWMAGHSASEAQVDRMGLLPRKNPFDVSIEIGGGMMVGHPTIGALNEVVNVANRFDKHPVYRGSYSYAETTAKGLPAHERLDVITDPMEPSYYVVPPDLFQFSDLYLRRFPENDPAGKPLANQTGRAP
jgi:hypothetical protein